MNTVFKYPIGWGGSVKMPYGATVLSAIVQHNSIVVYALVDTEVCINDLRYFEVYGTGHSIPEPDGLSFVDTVSMKDGDLVFHVYERK